MRRTLAPSALALLLAAGCEPVDAGGDADARSQAGPQSGPGRAPVEISRTGEPQPQPQPQPQPAGRWPASLRGEWRLAGVNGKPFDAPVGVAIYIGQDRIEFDNCQQVVWAYRYDPPRLEIRRTPAITIDINPKPQPCAARFPPQLEAMVAAIDAANTVRETPENGVLLSGGDGSVLLFRQ